MNLIYPVDNYIPATGSQIDVRAFRTGSLARARSYRDIKELWAREIGGRKRSNGARDNGIESVTHTSMSSRARTFARLSVVKRAFRRRVALYSRR